MLQAGLGNQLFIYGTALAMARRLGTDLHLDTSLFRFDTRRNYELGFFDTGASEILGKFQHRSGRRKETSKLSAKFAQYLSIRKLSRSPNVLMETTKSFDSRVTNWGDGTILLGYFQCWRYLQTVQNEVRQRVNDAKFLDQKTEEWVLQQKAMIRELTDPVIVHVRRGDYVLPAHRGFHGLLEQNYYETALANLANGPGYREVVLVSDDMPAAKQMFAGIPVIHIEQPKDISDSATLLALSTGNKYVIANSSFSWWWAWLAKADFVYAPKQWFARNDLDSSDICPPEWHLL